MSNKNKNTKKRVKRVIEKKEDARTILAETFALIKELDGFLPGEEITLKKGTPKELKLVVDEIPLPYFKNFLEALADLFVYMDEKEIDIDNFDKTPLSKMPIIFVQLFDKIAPLLYMSIEKEQEWFIENKIGINDSMRIIAAVIKANSFEDIVKNARSLMTEVKDFVSPS